jgi:hypothetical protein
MQQQEKHNTMKKKEETKKQPVPVMKQLARPMSKEELATVSGAISNFSGNPHEIDFLN